MNAQKLFTAALLSLSAAGAAGSEPVTTVQELVAVLESRTKSTDIIEIAPGTYDLSGIVMRSDTSFGDSHLFLQNATLVGVGNTREEVKLIGNGLRVLWAYAPAKIRNLTITNGCASAITGQSNSGRGGGVFGNCTVSNCVIAGCSAVSGGAVRNNTVLRNCDIMGNTAKTGGGVYESVCHDCTIAFNTSTEHGGGAYGTTSLYGCHVVSNTAASMGGGACAITLASNCWFEANSAGAQGGAAASWNADGMKFVDCTISNNTAIKSGGGTYKATIVKVMNDDCKVVDNSSAEHGGGISHSVVSGGVEILSNHAVSAGGGAYSSSINGGRIAGNYAGTNGGGACASQLSGVDVSDNYALQHGGGIEGGNAEKSTVGDNFCGGSGPNAAFAALKHCDISGTPCFQISALGCIFHGIGKSVALVGNKYAEAELTPVHVLSDFVNCTNCLFSNNKSTKWDGSIFGGNSGAVRKSSLVNCTIVSNSFAYAFKYFQSPSYPLSIVNCAFYGNTTEDGVTGRDISMLGTKEIDPQSIRFSNCAYGTSNVANLNDFVDERMYRFGEDDFASTPKFVGDKDADNPYALKRSSPLCGRGKVFDWMAGATDIRGEGFARLRDGKDGKEVDIGCYQCWLMPVGMRICIK